MHKTLDVQVTRFSFLELENDPELLMAIADLYCQIWEMDPNFGEYMRCTSCNRYPSFEEVEVNGFKVCPECSSGLEKAWEPKEVSKNLLNISKHHTFGGAICKSEGRVVGFSWGLLYTNQQMIEKWGNNYKKLMRLNQHALFCFYLEELAVSNEFRRMGIGVLLTKEVLRHGFVRYPDQTSAMSTHKNSHALEIYLRGGYQVLGEHRQGQDRINLGISRMRDVRIFEI